MTALDELLQNTKELERRLQELCDRLKTQADINDSLIKLLDNYGSRIKTLEKTVSRTLVTTPNPN